MIVYWIIDVGDLILIKNNYYFFSKQNVTKDNYKNSII